VSKTSCSEIPKAYNAALSGEQRDHLNQTIMPQTLKLIQTEIAKRCESVLNALLAKFYHHCVRQFIT
ncbi:hypothetical protein, partial [Vibrio parahaemolyticus]|uniref:hypothetical protein n=1 Tax=Vibrio parahaemolyticus TaxID=670 RepID=UPI00356B713A